MTDTIRAYAHRGRHRAAPTFTPWRILANAAAALSSSGVLLVTGILWGAL